MAEEGEEISDLTGAGREGDTAENLRGETSAEFGSFNADGERRLRIDRRNRISQWRERQVVDGRGLAGDAVVVHRIDAVGGDVHLEEVAIAGAEVVDALDGDAAQGEVVGELSVGDGEGGKIVAEPVGENFHGGRLLV